MKAVIFTLGCKVNTYESLSLMNGLRQLGYEVSFELSPADLYVINTCAVTAEAERKSRQAIARARKYSPDAKVIVTGCASQKNPQSFLDKEGVYLVTGAINKDRLIEIIDKDGVFIENSKEYYCKYYPIQTSMTRYFLKIQDGCDNFCSYCVIPYLRGRSRSRDPESILNELSGVKAAEVVLTGINLSAYDYKGYKLSDLLKDLSSFNVRIRLGSLEDNVVDDKLINALKGLPDFAEHFHLSLQSGSDKVLREMNRHYDTALFSRSVELIRENFPNAGITTDVIVGYSTETDEDFIKTYDFCLETAFSDIHCFEYSRREGTVGYKLPSLPDSVKKQRLSKLLQLKAQLKQSFINKNVGATLSFVPEEYKEGFTVGYTGNYLRVYVNDRLPIENKYDVTMDKPFKDGLLATVK